MEEVGAVRGVREETAVSGFDYDFGMGDMIRVWLLFSDTESVAFSNTNSLNV